MKWLRKYLLSNSLQKKIAVAFTLLIFFQILLFAVVTYWFDTRSIFKQVSEANLLTLDEMKNRLETEIRMLDRVSNQLSKDSQINDFLGKISTYSRNDPVAESFEKNQVVNVLTFANESWPEISNLHVINLLGNMVSKSRFEVAIPTPRLSDYTEAQTHIDYGISLDETNSPDDAVISYLRLIRDKSGKELGWVRLDMVLNELDLMRDLRKDPRAFLVFEPFGKLILSNKPDDLDIVTLAKILNIRGKRGSILYENNMINYTKSEYTGWRVVSIVPEKILNQGLLGNKLISAALVALSFMISVIASTLLAYRISRPIRNLYRSMKRIEEGNLNTRVEVYANDEIGQLGKRMNSMMDSIHNLINQVYKAELKYRDAQFQTLLMQINPHFLYNTLEIIDILALKGKQKEVSQTIYSLTAMFRYVLKSQKYVKLEDEVKYAESYMKIQQIRYPSNFRYKIMIPEHHMQKEVPVFILQPIIENAFKHSFFQKKWNILLIYAENDDQYFKVHIVNNGKGLRRADLLALQDRLRHYDEMLPLEGKNIGLPNVNYRIRLTYGPQYGVMVDSREDYWFKVTIMLPIKEARHHDV